MAITATMYRDSTRQTLTPELEEQKRFMYEKMSPRRRKFIDRIGYDEWDPFQKPNDPIEMRQDVTKRTTQQLVREFLQTHAGKPDYTNEYGQGVLECALGIINRDEKYKGIFEFAIWYNELLKKEGLHEHK